MKILENKHYIRIGDETVALDGEVKKTWDKAINNARNYARKTNACGQPDFRCCCGDCPLCPWYRNYRDSINISMDDKDPEWINRLSSNPGKRSYMPAQEINDPADLIGERDAIDAVMKQAQRSCEDGAQILQLMMENCSSYEIAKEIGIPQRTAYRRIQKLRMSLANYYRRHFID